MGNGRKLDRGELKAVLASLAKEFEEVTKPPTFQPARKSMLKRDGQTTRRRWLHRRIRCLSNPETRRAWDSLASRTARQLVVAPAARPHGRCGQPTRGVVARPQMQAASCEKPSCCKALAAASRSRRDGAGQAQKHSQGGLAGPC
jgi:hypothetical protein